MATKQPTKADLAAAVVKLTEENAGLRKEIDGLRGLLAAVSECAGTVPVSKGNDSLGEWRRSTSVLSAIKAAADISDLWNGRLAWGAAHVRAVTAEPVGYEVHAPFEDHSPVDESAWEHAENSPLSGADPTPELPAAAVNPDAPATPARLFPCCEHCPSSCGGRGHLIVCTRAGCPSARQPLAGDGHNDEDPRQHPRLDDARAPMITPKGLQAAEQAAGVSA